jgi:hypothetical protein
LSCRAHTLVLRRGRGGRRGTQEREGMEEKCANGKVEEEGREPRRPAA